MTTVTGSGAPNLRRLVWLSSLAVPAAALAMLIAGRLAALPVRITPVVTLLVVILLVNVWTFTRLRARGEIVHGEIFAQMLVDVVALTGLLYYSGGALNPFAYLVLLPLAICAIVLPQPYLWGMAAITAASYSFLLFYRAPLLPVAAQNSSVYVAGMWLAFMASVVMTAQFIATLGATMRRQERSLGEARERALQDERVVAVATLAAGAAHELSTPLATMALVTAELTEEYPRERDPQLHTQLELLRGQIRKCKESLSVISAAGGADRAGDVRHETVERFVQQAVSEVRTLRPGAGIRMQLAASGPAPSIIVERTLNQALLNVLHNAVDASPQAVTVTCDWDATTVRIQVDDRGPGISLATMRPGERPERSSKESGLGLGLFLTATALSHIGGDIRFTDAPGGGARVTLSLPLARLRMDD